MPLTRCGLPCTRKSRCNMPSIDTNRGLSPRKYAARLGVNVGKINRWLRTGELQAVNVATTTAGKPRWRILPEHIEQFERRRAATPKQPAPRRKQQQGITKYF